MQYCGYAVWNVHTKAGRERPKEEWVIAQRGHEPLITEEEARKIAEARRSFSGKKQFNAGASRSRISRYLLSGGLFRCGRCGANMIGFHTDGRFYYVCGSQPYRSGMGCGPGVYVPQAQVESEVLGGLRGVLDLCADPKKFTRAATRNYYKFGRGPLALGRMQASQSPPSIGGEHPPRCRGGVERRKLGEHPVRGTP